MDSIIRNLERRGDYIAAARARRRTGQQVDWVLGEHVRIKTAEEINTLHRSKPDDPFIAPDSRMALLGCGRIGRITRMPIFGVLYDVVMEDTNELFCVTSDEMQEV